MVIPWRTTHLKVPRTMRSTMSLRVSNEAMKFHDSPRSFWGSAMRDTGRTAAGDHRPSRWALLRRSPLFVTWSKGGGGRRWRREYTLRGCIGTLQARPLRGALPEYALTAAMRDPRFPPITQAGPLLLPAPHPTTPTSLAGPVQESTVSSDLMGLPCNDHRHASAGDNSCACCDGSLLTANLPGFDQRGRSSPAMLFCVSVPIASRRVSQAALRRAHTTCCGSAKGLGQVLDRGAGAGGGADIGGAAVWQGMAPVAYRPAWPRLLIRRLSTQISKLSRSLGACLHKVLCRYLMM